MSSIFFFFIFSHLSCNPFSRPEWSQLVKVEHLQSHYSICCEPHRMVLDKQVLNPFERKNLLLSSL